MDGSKRAEAILPHAEELARRYDAQVVFLHVAEPIPLVPHSDGSLFALEQQALEQQAERAETYLAGLQGEFREKGIEARTHVARGGPVVQEIINAAERNDADLIALASHGRTGLAQVFYGSVAAGVLHRVDRPLLLVRAPADH
jgi:nucleotide-binding universal stress UspA family protein